MGLFVCESVLHGTELACDSYCTDTEEPDWQLALEQRLAAANSTAEQARKVRVNSLHNTQAHALTCSKTTGSFGHHFRVLENGVDSLEPNLDAALASLYRFEWIGITDLYEHSLCLLHYQANQTLPASCDCDAAARADRIPLGRWWKLGQNVVIRRHCHQKLSLKLMRTPLWMRGCLRQGYVCFLRGCGLSFTISLYTVLVLSCPSSSNHHS